MKKCFVLLLSGLLITSFMSCDDLVEVSDKERIMVCEDPEETGDYDIMVLDEPNSTFTLSRLNSTKELVERIDFFEVSDLTTLTFYENGLPESFIFSNDSIIIFMGNYKDNSFDMVIQVGDDVYLQQDIVFDYTNTRSVVGDLIDDIQEYLITHENKIEKIKYASGVASDMVSAGFDAFSGNIPGAVLKYLRSHVRAFKPIFSSDLISESLDLGIFVASTAKFFGLVAAGAGTVATGAAAIAAGIAGLPVAYAAGQGIANIQNGFTEWTHNLKGMLSSGIGSLKVTLSWSFYADIDLHAYEPNGNQIWYGEPTSFTGGYLDVDNRVGGPGAVENIFWEKPEEGAYHFYLNYYEGYQSGICTATVTYKGEGKTYSVPMTEGSWKNFASRLISKNTRSYIHQDEQALIMDIIIKPEKKGKSEEPIVRFRKVEEPMLTPLRIE